MGNYLPKTISVLDSKGQETKTEYKYPTDLVSTSPYDVMVSTKNWLTPIVSQTGMVNGQSTSKSTVNYANFPYVIAPQSVSKSKGGLNLENVVTYDWYDEMGNLERYTLEDGIPVTIIWGYNKQYPIAKMENATLAGLSPGIKAIVDAAVTASNNDVDEATENNLRTALNNVRNQFPDSTVTTYTHDPLVGVTSITDPKGYITYYEYDDFNRLKQAKDASGKILSANEYNYKP
jgi:YD repeat-containing protein